MTSQKQSSVNSGLYFGPRWWTLYKIVIVQEDLGRIFIEILLGLSWKKFHKNNYMIQIGFKTEVTKKER